MSTRCRPGDLAMIVKAQTHPEALGRLVLVIRRLQPGDMLENGGRWRPIKDFGPVWEVQFANGEKCRMLTAGGCPAVMLGWPISDDCLRPIRPQPDEETQEPAKEPTHAPA